jgi:hypothetical protein
LLTFAGHINGNSNEKEHQKTIRVHLIDTYAPIILFRLFFNKKKSCQGRRIHFWDASSLTFDSTGSTAGQRSDESVSAFFFFFLSFFLFFFFLPGSILWQSFFRTVCSYNVFIVGMCPSQSGLFLKEREKKGRKKKEKKRKETAKASRADQFVSYYFL